ncbi:hypothetical protein G159_16270 [Planococcus glaciei CHR43]|uniref:glycosyltransferase family 1 protein n=1 Tax=Planococcus glaciei TaxID=459472 RepID=UPI0003DEFAA5|nr:glycosyltransferase family 1 protein [Planococcus glaciei]ETP67654.1 hypothetical protein G159_16270 [Planococcus glaciei CHR43]
MEPIRILYVNGGIMHRGGIESYMMNYYRHIDRSKIQIDFVVHGFEKGVYDDEIKLMGGRIFNVPVKSKNYFGNIKALKDIFKTGNYKIIHSHMDAMNTVVLKQAKKLGVPIRISHSHSTDHYTKNKIKYFINELTKLTSTLYATDLWACSYKSGEWLYGKKNLTKINIVPNAISIEDFIYDKKVRKNMRELLGINSEYVIGHVGNFNEIKNHEFLINAFKKVQLKLPNSKLILVGKGEKQKDIKALVMKLKIDDKVIFLNDRDDVHNIMQVFDIFALPSKFEGFPVVAIEAQCSGLKCIFSDKITKEICIVEENVNFLSIDNTEEVWCSEILKDAGLNNREIIKDKKFWQDFDIEIQAKILENKYISRVKEG